MFHGGTNFGWMAGANYGTRYEPDITSYDYDAPLDEAGNPTRKYYIFKNLLSTYLPLTETLPSVPNPITSIDIPDIKIEGVAPLFKNLPQPNELVQPKSMEKLGQDYGFILYRTKLIGPKSGSLTATDLHDYGLVYLNGAFVDTIDRTKNESTVKLSETGSKDSTLDILVEAMGRVNFGQHLIDRKGITERVTLRGITLMHWKAFCLPMDRQYLEQLAFVPNDSSDSPKFFRGSFTLQKLGDTFLDLSKWTKGIVWVNGHNLGRYWSIGPQRRLYVPGPWLKKGKNEVVIFDMFLKGAAPLGAERHMNDPANESN